MLRSVNHLLSFHLFFYVCVSGPAVAPQAPTAHPSSQDISHLQSSTLFANYLPPNKPRCRVSLPGARWRAPEAVHQGPSLTSSLIGGTLPPVKLKNSCRCMFPALHGSRNSRNRLILQGSAGSLLLIFDPHETAQHPTHHHPSHTGLFTLSQKCRA